MAGQNIFEGLNDLPFRRYALAQMNRVDDMVERIGVPALFDQYPGKIEPTIFSCIYGPIPMLATRTIAAGTGFDKLAALVSTSTPFLPRDANPLTGANHSFKWTDWNVAGFLQWGYDAAPGLAAPVPIDTQPLADIFDPVFDNGGAQIVQNFSQAFAIATGTTGNPPRICFEIDLYDRKRGRSITNGKVPSQVLLGGAYEFKSIFGPMRWDPDTEIEPRVYITEVKMTDDLVTDAAFNAAQVAVYLNICFRGYRSFTAHPSAAEY